MARRNAGEQLLNLEVYIEGSHHRVHEQSQVEIRHGIREMLEIF